jgi:hypothetical protein
MPRGARVAILWLVLFVGAAVVAESLRVWVPDPGIGISARGARRRPLHAVVLDQCRIVANVQVDDGVKDGGLTVVPRIVDAAIQHAKRAYDHHGKGRTIVHADAPSQPDHWFVGRQVGSAVLSVLLR